ncbi:uncharacterized protein EI90DRAFT_1910814 [Cantharellus anzutake]|uniref:uncharacterized protein n=1 Tax=Cantharellus anzutake TaxID=1750568 RepID=UPI0019063651|nr:uncharacterized protein EI90DRAFT_1910814 [Cantharellus anzutake]KAF8326598.1 hypothetical protein EI90DRAFT_1910814 [Cantharellus anzutake]
MASAGVVPSNHPASKPPSQTLSDIGILLPTVHLGSFKDLKVEQAQSSGSRRDSRTMSSRSSEPRRSLRQNEPTSFGEPIPSIALQDRAMHSQGNDNTLRGDDQLANGIPKEYVVPSSPRPSLQNNSPRLSQPQPPATTLSPPPVDPEKGLSESPRTLSSAFGNVLRPEDTSNAPQRSSTVSTSNNDDDNTSRNRRSAETKLRIVNGPWRIDPSSNADPHNFNTPNLPPSPPLINERPIGNAGTALQITKPYPPPSTANMSASRGQEQLFTALYSSPASAIPPSSPRYSTLPRQLASPKLTSLARPQYAQKVVAPEEVCIECMMRDRDMSDVDVTSPGIWERESDVWYEELCRKEEEDARLGISSSGKRRAYGDMLTEANLQVWLTMNPKEPAARWQTLEKFIKSQADLLAAELQAREESKHESHVRNSRLQDTYSQLRRSTLAEGPSSRKKESVDEGVRLRASASPDGVDVREVTLLPNGLIVERVDIKRQEREERERRKAEERAGRRRTRKTSRTSMGTFMSDASSIHSLTNPLQGVSYGNRSQISLSPTTATANKRLSSPLAGRPDASVNRVQSISSNEAVPPVPRFIGYRHWRGAHGSEVSLLNNSGSMLALHLGLENESEMYEGPYDEELWRASQVVDETYVEPRPQPEEARTKPKKGGLGRLWKMMTGKNTRRSKSSEINNGLRPQASDYDIPLDPPPPLSYLVSRNGTERPPQGRHVSTPPMQTIVPFSHPRSATVPSAAPNPNTPLSAPSLYIPSPSTPTSGRFSPRTSIISEDRRLSTPIDEVEVYTDDSYHRRDGQRAVHSVHGLTKPPEINFPYGQDSWRTFASNSPALTVKTTRTPRAPSISSIHKDLPPIPGDQFPVTRSQPSLRPASVSVPPHTVSTPWATEGRRQSVSGPPRGAQVHDLAPPPILYHYGVDDFGMSTPSLGRWEDEVRRPSLVPISEKSSRRRSRFANIASMFTGSHRRSVEREDKLRVTAARGIGLAPSDGQLYPRQMGQQPFALPIHPSYSETALRNSSSSAVTFPRTSKGSLTRYADLVPQESELLALRYTTEEEREELMRYRGTQHAL